MSQMVARPHTHLRTIWKLFNMSCCLHSPEVLIQRVWAQGGVMGVDRLPSCPPEQLGRDYGPRRPSRSPSPVPG